MKRRKDTIKIILLLILILAVLLFLIRLISPTEIDDITPGIPCPEIEMYNPDIFYVIPDYNNNLISQNMQWCSYILSLNKTLGLHGTSHTFKEFLVQDITQEQLNMGIIEFRGCFGYPPELFKPPQLAISNKNIKLIKENNLKLNRYFNQVTHKVYHCNNADKIPNKIINIF